MNEEALRGSNSYKRSTGTGSSSGFVSAAANNDARQNKKRKEVRQCLARINSLVKASKRRLRTTSGAGSRSSVSGSDARCGPSGEAGANAGEAGGEKAEGGGGVAGGSGTNKSGGGGTGGKKSGGTLSTLQNVIEHFKQLQEAKSDEGESSTAPGGATARASGADGSGMDGGGGGGGGVGVCVDVERLGSSGAGGDGGHTGVPSFPCGGDPHFHSVDFDYRIVLTPKHHRIVDASDGLLELAKYPKNYWRHQLLTRFMYRKDVATLRNHLSFSDAADGKHNGQNFFFARIRHYKNLRQGFSLSRPTKFLVFCVRASLRTLSLPPGPSTSLQSAPGDGRYVVLELKHVQSAYTREYKFLISPTAPGPPGELRVDAPVGAPPEP